MDYGHWKSLQDVDLKEYLGFVYVIIFEDGKKYVGAKKIWKRIKVPPVSFKRGPVKGFEESDWRTYTSSSKEVNDMINSGNNPKEYIIVGWYKTWGKTLMGEMQMQLANDVLRNPLWLNKQIGGHFNPNCFDDLNEADIERWMNYEKGNEHTSYPIMYKLGQKTKYVNPNQVQKYLDNGWQFGRAKDEKIGIYSSVSKFELYNCKTETTVNVTNLNEFARNNNLEPGHISRLLKGDIDIIHDEWSLKPGIRRNLYVAEHVQSGKKYKTLAELDSLIGKRGSSAKLFKSGEYIKLKPETRTEYKKRLKTLNLVETVKVENTLSVMTNLNREILRNAVHSEKDKENLISWLEKYIEYLKE